MMRGTAVPGGKQRRTPGTLLRSFRGRWTAGKGHLERFRRKTVPGGRQERTPDTLLQGNRGKVRKDLCFDFHSQDGKRIALIIGAVTAECSESHPLVEFHS